MNTKSISLTIIKFEGDVTKWRAFNLTSLEDGVWTLCIMGLDEKTRTYYNLTKSSVNRVFRLINDTEAYKGVIPLVK